MNCLVLHFAKRAIENPSDSTYWGAGGIDTFSRRVWACFTGCLRCSTNHPERIPAGSIWVKDDKVGQHAGGKTNQQQFCWKKLVAYQTRSIVWNLVFKETASEKGDLRNAHTDLWRIELCTQIAQFSMRLSVVFKECVLVRCIFLRIDLVVFVNSRTVSSTIIS